MMRIAAEIREMSQSELANMISSEELARIRGRDPHPRFLGFVIGHEGIAAGHVIGTIGDTVKRWFRGAIMKLNSAVRIGLQLFSGHQETNEVMGRTPIGEVVGRKVDQVQGRVSSIIAAWVYPEFKDRNYDVCSIEANIQMEADKEHGLVVVDVDSVSAIALGQSSLGMKPGFAGATLISALQMFANDHGLGVEPQVIGPDTDLTPLCHEAAARTLLGDRDSLTLEGGAILTKMAGGCVTVNGRTFGELGEEDGGDVRKIIDNLLFERQEAATIKYRDPARNPFIPRAT